MALDTERKLIILGGQTNALSTIRSLGRKGVSVHAIAATKSVSGYSRYAARPSYFFPSAELESRWKDLLIDNRDRSLEGALVLALNDSAIHFISEHAPLLRQFYLLEQNDPEIRERLLDKKETLRIAAEAGLNVPKSWRIDSETDVLELASKMAFPILVKPIYSHLFHSVFGVKLFLIHSIDEAIEVIEKSRRHSLDVMFCEWIPGPDSNICSYYAYYDRSGRRITEFTKFVIRRFPQYFGGGVYHGTSWQTDVVDAGRRFFDHLGMKGICNIEFKRDPRNGALAVIESNPRLTAAQELLLRSGLDLAELAYRDATGQNMLITDGAAWDYGRTLWYPRQDYAASVALRRSGQLSFLGWLRSIARIHTLPVFRLSDPYPSLVLNCRHYAKKLLSLARNRRTTSRDKSVA